MFTVFLSARSPSMSQALDGRGRGGGMLWKMVCRQGLAAAPQRSPPSSPVHPRDRQSWADHRVQLRHGEAPQRNNPLRVISSESWGQPGGGLGADFHCLQGACERAGGELFQKACRGRPRGMTLKLEEDRF